MEVKKTTKKKTSTTPIAKNVKGSGIVRPKATKPAPAKLRSRRKVIAGKPSTVDALKVTHVTLPVSLPHVLNNEIITGISGGHSEREGVVDDDQTDDRRDFDDRERDYDARRMARRKRHLRMIYMIRAIMFLALLGAPFFAWKYFYSQSHKVASEQKEISSLLDQVASVVDVPMGGKPQIFRVTDPEKLATEGTAFSGLSIGDRIIYYQETNTVVVYSEEKKKIIAVTRIIDNDPVAQVK